MPVGYQSIGMHVDNFDENACIAYYGSNIQKYEEIIRNGFSLPNHRFFNDSLRVSPSYKYASFFGIQKKCLIRKHTD